MTEKRGDLRSLRQCIIAGLSLMVMTGLAGACRGGNEPAAEETAAVTTAPEPSPSPTLPVAAIAPVGRAELLAAAAAAADEVAAGNPPPKANLDLTNRTFELRLPFGCADGVSGSWGEWSLDPRTRVLRIRARPQIWGDDPMFEALAPGITYDAAEGFWVERPWTRSEQCPPTPPPDSAPATEDAPAPDPNAASAPKGKDQPAPTSGTARAARKPATGTQPEPGPPAEPMQTFALVQYFSPDAPRTLRRGSRPYSYTAKVPESEPTGPRNFRLKLMGRIRGFDDGQPVHCIVTAPSRPPVCAASVEFVQVILEDADTGQSLTEWNS